MVMLMRSWYYTLLLYSVQTFKNKKACLQVISFSEEKSRNDPI